MRVDCPPVFPQKRHDLAGFQAETHLIQCLDAGKAFADPVKPNDIVVHMHTPSYRNY